jgi:hypothetical protein
LASQWGVEKLTANFSRKEFCKQRRDGISKHALDFGAITFKFEVVRESLQARELVVGELPICPMKRPSCRAGLGLDRPRRSVLGEF